MDNPALTEAVAAGRPVLPLYILDDETPGSWRLGGASRWWLHHSLDSLARDLERRGSGLLLRRGRAGEVLRSLVEETKASRVYWNRCYEAFAVERDREIKAALKAAGVEARSFGSSLLFEPWTIKTGQEQPFKVFTPFFKALLASPPPALSCPTPERMPQGTAPHGDELGDWDLRPAGPDWSGGLHESWRPGEGGGLACLERLLDEALPAYGTARDLPAEPGTSRLSPHLHWGEISPRLVWHRVRDRIRSSEEVAGEDQGLAFLRQLAWREFCYHLLFHWPDLPTAPWRADFERFPWREDAAAYGAWCRGLTGYPFVDAGMRELWHCGWMHNRVRMVAASFLTKHLLLPWRLGAAWFWDTLVDADLANNSAGWQWVAGCGADAAPYFRVFNPVRQGERFDPDGAYLRRWLPELAGLPNAVIHRPWEASTDQLRQAGIELGSSYPAPLIEHAFARQRALEAYKAMKQADAEPS